MKKRFGIWVGVLAVGVWAMLAGLAAAHAESGKLNVVTSTVLFEDLVKRIGGDRVEVKHVASPRFNIHFIQPKPSDVRNTAKADLFVFGGLDHEAWVDPLLEASGNRKLFRGGERSVDMSKGIPLIGVPVKLDRGEGDIHAFGNPHYVMNPEFLRQMAKTLAEGLKAADPAGAPVYDARLAQFLSELDAKLTGWRAMVAPLRGKEIVSYHEDIAYLADFAGLRSEVFVEPKPGIPPTPKQVQFLEAYLPAHQVSALVSPTYNPKNTLEELRKRTGVPVAYVPQSPGEIPGTEDVFVFFDTVFQTLKEKLR